MDDHLDPASRMILRNRPLGAPRIADRRRGVRPGSCDRRDSLPDRPIRGSRSPRGGPRRHARCHCSLLVHSFAHLASASRLGSWDESLYGRSPAAGCAPRSLSLPRPIVVWCDEGHPRWGWPGLSSLASHLKSPDPTGPVNESDHAVHGHALTAAMIDRPTRFDSQSSHGPWAEQAADVLMSCELSEEGPHRIVSL
jgi:hypothetical protein